MKRKLRRKKLVVCNMLRSYNNECTSSGSNIRCRPGC